MNALELEHDLWSYTMFQACQKGTLFGFVAFFVFFPVLSHFFTLTFFQPSLVRLAQNGQQKQRKEEKFGRNLKGKAALDNGEHHYLLTCLLAQLQNHLSQAIPSPLFSTIFFDSLQLSIYQSIYLYPTRGMHTQNCDAKVSAGRPSLPADVHATKWPKLSVISTKLLLVVGTESGSESLRMFKLKAPFGHSQLVGAACLSSLYFTYFCLCLSNSVSYIILRKRGYFERISRLNTQQKREIRRKVARSEGEPSNRKRKPERGDKRGEKGLSSFVLMLNFYFDLTDFGQSNRTQWNHITNYYKAMIWLARSKRVVK